MNQDSVLPIIQKYQNKRGSLISILEEVQGQHGYLPKDILQVVASETGRDLVDISSPEAVRPQSYLSS
jgi:NADH:ubiquinone oxidoreductase subunit E